MTELEEMIYVEGEEGDLRRRVTPNENWQIPIETFADKLTSDENLGKLKWKQKLFYKNQNDIIRSLMDAHNQVETLPGDLTEEEAEANESAALSKKIALYGSAGSNIFLLFLKIFAAYFSGSLSVLASALDSFLDILSGAILFIMEIVANKTSERDYPAGKSRFEPVGIVIFSSCMFTATFQLLISSIQTLITQDIDITVDTATLVILMITIVLKFFLWMYCRTVKGSEAVNALALDHRNDVVSNIFGVTTALLGYHYRWWIDPMGAVCISLYLMFIWFRTGLSQLSSLTGKTASPEFLQTLTLIARNHHKDIIAIDTVRAYEYGYKYMVELDIVLDPEMRLRETHDIGESLQNKLELLENVERAFVHIDYEWEHKPEHSGRGY